MRARPQFIVAALVIPLCLISWFFVAVPAVAGFGLAVGLAFWWCVRLDRRTRT